MNYLRLGVNIDHVATLRNARGEVHPDPVRAAKLALVGGADGITVHLREDRRHIRDDDVWRLRREVPAPLNLELAATDEMVAIACEVAPPHCCIVPERREEITTEGGLDAAGQRDQLAPLIDRLKAAGIRVSLFLDPEEAQLQAAAALGAEAVELHAGAYSLAAPGAAQQAEADRLIAGARRGTALGLEMHAGHGLTFENAPRLAACLDFQEFNIGHFLIGEAVFAGLEATIRRMRSILDRARAAAAE